MTTAIHTTTIELDLNDAAFLALTLRIAVQQDPSIATDHVKALYAKLVQA